MNPRRVVHAAGGLLDQVISPPPGITILIYHRVGGQSVSAVDLDPEVFDVQLAHLVTHHRVLSLDDALAELAIDTGWATAAGDPSRANPTVDSVGSDPRRPVVVTVDDGTADFCEVVVPALVRHQVPATLYVATEFIDTGRPFPWGAPPASWPALRDTVETGLVTIGSHSHAHWLFDRLAPATVTEDLDRSIELIGEHLGVAARHFAYPKAVPGSPFAEIEVRRRFASAALARSRVNRPGRTDPHRLWRTPIQRSDDAGTFARKADGGLRLDGELRAHRARWRYRRDQQ